MHVRKHLTQFEYVHRVWCYSMLFHQLQILSPSGLVMTAQHELSMEPAFQSHRPPILFESSQGVFQQIIEICAQGSPINSVSFLFLSPCLCYFIIDILEEFDESMKWSRECPGSLWHMAGDQMLVPRDPIHLQGIWKSCLKKERDITAFMPRVHGMRWWCTSCFQVWCSEALNIIWTNKVLWLPVYVTDHLVPGFQCHYIK